jgi:hypothetical protein
MKVNNIAIAFKTWNFENQVAKRALDKRQKLFLVNNAKIEV